MRKFYLFLLVLIFNIESTQSQFDTIYMYNSFRESGTDVIHAANGNYIFVGYDDLTGGSSVWTFSEVDSYGNIVKHFTYGPGEWSGIDGNLITNRDMPYTVLELDSGYFVISGRVTDSLIMSRIMKIDTSGAVVWIKDYIGDHLYSGFRKMCHAVDGGYLWVGNMNQLPAYGKLDLSGNLMWYNNFSCDSTKYKPESFKFDYIITTSDSGYLLLGNVNRLSGGHGIFTIKIDKHGDTLWTSINIPNTPTDSLIGYSCIETLDGYIIIGQYNSKSLNIPTTLSTREYLFKIDTVGNIMWDKCIPSANHIL